MKKTIGSVTVELSVDTIFIRDAKTKTLLKAKSFRASEVMDEYDKIVEKLTEKFFPSRTRDIK